MDPNRASLNSEPPEARAPGISPGQTQTPLKKEKPNTIEKALEMQKKYEPAKTETFGSRLLPDGQEFKKDAEFRFRYPYTFFSEDKLLAAHQNSSKNVQRTPQSEVIVFNGLNLTEIG